MPPHGLCLWTLLILFNALEDTRTLLILDFRTFFFLVSARQGHYFILQRTISRQTFGQSVILTWLLFLGLDIENLDIVLYIRDIKLDICIIIYLRYLIVRSN